MKKFTLKFGITCLILLGFFSATANAVFAQTLPALTTAPTAVSTSKVTTVGNGPYDNLENSSVQSNPQYSSIYNQLGLGQSISGAPTITQVNYSDGSSAYIAQYNVVQAPPGDDAPGTPSTPAGTLSVTTSDPNGNTLVPGSLTQAPVSTTGTGGQTPTQVNQNEAAAQAAGESASCGWISAFEFWNPGCMLQSFSTILLAPSAFFLWIAGGLLNISIQYSVINISSYVNIPGITIAWGLIRDLCNLIFIGVLIFISVKTILGSGEWKKVLPSIIIAALLINFSMFFTEVMIDASNIVTLQFYNAIPGATNVNYGIAGTIVKNTALSTVYAPPPNTTASGQTTANQTVGSSLVSTGGQAIDGVTNFIVSILMGSLLILITAFVFLVAGILFITRLIVLLILIVLSPIAFIGSVLPKLKSMVGDKWWSALTGQLLFAPVFMMLIWLSITILAQINILKSPATAGDPATIVSIVNYCIIIGFMVTSVIVAKQLGAVGADFAQKISGKAVFGGAAALTRGGIFAGKNIISGGKEVLTTGSVKNTWAAAKKDISKNSGATLKQIRTGIAKPFKDLKDNDYDLRGTAPVQAIGSMLGSGGFGTPESKADKSKRLEGELKAQNKKETAAKASKQETQLENDIDKTKPDLEAAKKTLEDPNLAITDPKYIQAKQQMAAAEGTIQQTLYKISSQEITALDKDITTNEEIIKLMRSDQFEALTNDKNENLTFKEKEDIKTSRNNPFAKFTEVGNVVRDAQKIIEDPNATMLQKAAASQRINAIGQSITSDQKAMEAMKEVMKNRDSSEVAKMDVETLAGFAATGQLGSRAREAINKRENLAPTEKRTILKTATNSALLGELHTITTGLGGTASKTAQTIMKSMSAQDLADFIKENPSYTQDDAFTSQLTVSKLKDMSDIIDNPAIREEIGKTILNNSNASANSYLQSDKSGIWV